MLCCYTSDSISAMHSPVAVLWIRGQLDITLRITDCSALLDEEALVRSAAVGTSPTHRVKGKYKI